MTTRCRALPVLVLSWLLAAGQSAAAQDAPAFDRACSALAVADAAHKGAAARAAATAFLALPAGTERAARLLEGAEALLADDRPALALDALREARSRGMRNGRMARIAVAATLRGGAFAEAMSVARQQLVEWPTDVRAALLAHEPLVAAGAQRSLRQGDFADGRLAFEQLAAAQPLAAYRIANFALCLRQLGEVAAARRQYDLARSLAPDDLEVENDFGLFLRAQGDLRGALAAFQRGWRLDLARPVGLRARGPAVTNLVHLAAIGEDAGPTDVLIDASRALAARPDAAMLQRLVLDVAVERSARAR